MLNQALTTRLLATHTLGLALLASVAALGSASAREPAGYAQAEWAQVEITLRRACIAPRATARESRARPVRFLQSPHRGCDPGSGYTWAYIGTISALQWNPG